MTQPLKTFLCLWLPNWPIQRLVAKQPELKKTHIVLFRRDPRRGQIIAAASPLSLRDGVQPGMPLSEAKSLLKQATASGKYHLQGRHPRTQHAQVARNGVPQIATPSSPENESPHAPTQEKPKHKISVWEHDPVNDRKTLTELVDQLHQFSPIAGIEQTDSPESVFLEITGLVHLFGDEYQLATQVTEYCEKKGFLARVAIAHTPGLAWGRARYANNGTPLSALPIEALRLSTATLETLNQLGIRSIKQLLQIPRTHLTSRFGDEIHRRIDQATGKIDEPIVARHRPPEFEAEQFIEFPTSDRETINVILQRLVTNVCEQMRHKQQGSLEWTIKLACLESPTIEFKANLFQPTATEKHVLPIIQMQLEIELQPHTRKRRKRKASQTSKQNPDKPSRKFREYTTIQVQEVSVSVTSCVLLSERQRQLFDDNPRLDKQSLAHLINRLAARLGNENVVYPLLQSGAQPEYSVRFRPLVDPRSRYRWRKSHVPRKQSHVMARPLQLLNPPQPIECSSLNPESPPALLSVGQQQQNIVHVWGPERIETGWWRGPTTRRDYWRIATETNQQFWIYFDLRRRTWFLHGEF